MPRMKLKIQETSRVLKALEVRLRPLLPKLPISGRLAADMADIHQICRTYLCCVDEFIEDNQTNQAKAEELFFKIDCELFEHLPFHLRSLRKLIPQVKRAIQQRPHAEQRTSDKKQVLKRKRK